MQDEQKLVSSICLIPAYNEEATIARVIVDALDFCDQVIVYDDGSTDSTSKIAKNLGCNVIRNERNQGKGEALRQLFKAAISLQAETVITIDADGQHDPKDIPKLMEALKDSDMVIGARPRKDIPFHRKAGLYFFDKMISSGHDSQSGFRAYRGGILPRLIPTEFGMGADGEILAKAKEEGLKIGSVPISISYKGKTSKQNTWLHTQDVYASIFKSFIRRRPLTSLGIPAILFLLGAFYYSILIRQDSLLGTHGFEFAVYHGIMMVTLLIIGILLFAIALIILVIVPTVRESRDNLSILGLGLILTAFLMDASRAVAFFHVKGMLSFSILMLITMGWSISNMALLKKGVSLRILASSAPIFALAMWGEVIVPWSDVPKILLTAFAILATPLVAVFKR